MTANKATPEELDRIAEDCARSLFTTIYEESDKVAIRAAIDQGIALAAADLIESLQKPACPLGGTTDLEGGANINRREKT